MAASFVILPDRVAVSVRGRLNFDSWRVMRDARIIALERQLPLSIDVTGCIGGDMGGLGALMIAQHQLGKVEINGCGDDFANWFDKIGVCARCSHSDHPEEACQGRVRQMIAA